MEYVIEENDVIVYFLMIIMTNFLAFHCFDTAPDPATPNPIPVLLPEEVQMQNMSLYGGNPQQIMYGPPLEYFVRNLTNNT